MAEPKSIADLEKNADDGSIGYDVHGSFSYVGHNQQRNPGSDQINMVAQDDEARDGVEEEDHAGVPTQEEKDCEVDQEDLERAVTTSSASPPVHSVFSHRYKIFIVTIAGIGSFFSPLTANIYFPALDVLSKDLHVSSGLINLSLTTYMIFQGLAPTFVGDLGDTVGRRPSYILGFIIYIGACIGLALQNDYAALLILRCMQSSGSSSMVALSSGVGADIATAAERGKWMGWIQAGSLVGPAVGPVLGGILAQFLGWRWIFWFLVILAGVYMIPLVLFFPETGRNVVGDGSIPPQRWNRPLQDLLRERQQRNRKDCVERAQSIKSANSARAQMAAKRKLRMPNPFNSWKIVFQKDVGLLLLLNSLVYTAFYDVAASLPYMFAQTYNFNQLQIGLAFLPFGAGNFLAPVINGYVLRPRTHTPKH